MLSVPANVWSNFRPRFDAARWNVWSQATGLLSLIMLAMIVTPSNAVAQRGVSTTNFTVYADDAAFARRVAGEAERFRRELSMEWLGYEIKPWNERCPITVEIGMHAGGETSFAFMTPPQGGRGYPTGWQMKIFGPPDRLLDAVLPHEITHTIFATHFGQPLPRWADEGACTTVEHVSEREKNHEMLMSFLGGSPSRGIPFNRMFTMRNYPHDILPLYAQGYSLAKFLIQKKGRREFLDYIASGMASERPGLELRAWDDATEQHYGFDDLSDLQIQWLQWVKSGSPDAAAMLASTASNSRSRPAPTMLPHATTGSGDVATKLVDSGNQPPARELTAAPKQDARFIDPLTQPQTSHSQSQSKSPAARVASLTGQEDSSVASLPINDGWYAKQMKQGQSSRRIAASRQTIEIPDEARLDAGSVTLPPNPSKTIWR